MKNKTIQALVFGSMVCMLLACKNETPAIDKEQIKKEIQAKEDQFAATYNAGELKDIGYYADDATTFYPNRAPLVGKKAIVDFLAGDIGGNSNKIAYKTKDIFISSDGNQVVEVGSFTLTDSANNVLNTGNYMSLFEKRNGSYVSVRDMSASDVPRE
jgi:ketosteroid isomerase-like protein